MYPQPQETAAARLQALRHLADVVKMKDEAARTKAFFQDAQSPDRILYSEARRYILRIVRNEPDRRKYKDDVVALLHSRSPEAGRTALMALEMIKAPEATLIIAATCNADSQIVQSASIALKHYGTAESVDALLHLCSNPDPKMRCRGILDIGYSTRPEAGATIRRLLEDPDQGVRGCAATSTTWWYRREQGKDFTPVLIRMLSDPGEEVRVNAANALSESKDISVVEPLLTVLRQDGVGERTENFAMQALSALAVSNSSEVIPILDKNRELIVASVVRGRWMAPQYGITILSISRSPEALVELHRIATSHPSEHIRTAAQAALDRTDGK